MLAQAARAAASAVNHQAAPARVLTAMEKAKLVCWFEETNSFAQTARRYRAEFGMEPPHFEQVKKWHQRFMSTGSLTNGHGGSGWLEAHSNGDGGNDGQHGRMDATDTSFGLEAEEQLKMGGLH